MTTRWSRFFGALTLGWLLLAGSVWWIPEAASDDETVTTDNIGDKVQTRRGGALPQFATGEAAALYTFAKTRGDVLKWIPCTCGCGQLGHTSNRSCYIKAETGDRTTWTSHAAT